MVDDATGASEAADTPMASELETLWESVEGACGPISPPGRAAHETFIADLRALDVPMAAIAGLLALRISEARNVVAAGLDAFEGLGQAIAFVGENATATPAAAAATMDHQLELKARMARLYHFLASVAPTADVAVASVEDTAEMLLASDEALAAWRAAEHGADADQPDGPDDKDG